MGTNVVMRWFGVRMKWDPIKRILASLQPHCSKHWLLLLSQSQETAIYGATLPIESGVLSAKLVLDCSNLEFPLFSYQFSMH